MESFVECDEGMAYVNDLLNLTKDSSNGSTDEWDGGEETSLADQDVKKSLVDLDELAE